MLCDGTEKALLNHFHSCKDILSLFFLSNHINVKKSEKEISFI